MKSVTTAPRRRPIVSLFSYGTLRDTAVQCALFGRGVDGAPDALVGFTLGSVTILDPVAIERSGKAVHTIVDPSADPADRVPGVVLSLSEAELAIADAYEDEAYKRVTTRLASGREAFVYVRA